MITPLSELVELPEGKLLEKLVQDWPTLYHFFDFVVRPALGEPAIRKDWDYILIGNIPRTYFGLPSKGQPGDVDILIVPVLENRAHPELCAAIEVKRLALRGPNWEKGTDRYGLRQANGLLRAGFPFVGLMHVVVSLPGPERYHRHIEYGEVLDSEGNFRLLGGHVDDMTATDAVDRQYRRLFSQDPPLEIGINCVAVGECLYKGKRHAITSMTRGRDAKPNPRMNPILVHNVGLLIEVWREQIPLRRFDAKPTPA